MNAPFKPVARGPQNGAPPSLEFVALDRLNVDPAYQRATDGPLSRRLVVGMVREWEWPLCQPLVVARRLDGTLWVLDGQHRLAGARERGDIAHLPCVVLPALAAEEEARAFVDLNTRRQKLSQTDIFNGRLAAGDQSAKSTAAMIERTGWRIVRSSATDGWKPGDLVCAPMIMDQRRLYGEAIVESALATLRQAYPETVVTAPANLIKALVQLYRPDGTFAPVDRPAVAAGMSRVVPDRWLGLAHRLRAKDPAFTLVAALARSIEGAVARDTMAKRGPLRDVPVTAAPARPVVSISPPQQPIFRTEGKGWCEQCDQLVSRERAATCRSAFCKMGGGRS